MRLSFITIAVLCLTSSAGMASDEVELTTGGDTGPRVVIDDSADSHGSTTLHLEDLGEQIPVVREVNEVVLLTPGTVRGDSAFDGRTPGQDLISIGGASVAENRYTVNGLNITNVRNGLGSTFVPFEFVQSVTVAAGGVDASYGGFTGGLVAMETKSGSNAFHGSVSAYFEPSDLQGHSPDASRAPFSLDHGRTMEVNGSLGGPVLRDRLFFFGFVQYIDSRTFEWTEIGPATGAVEPAEGLESASATPYWGGTLDWNIGPDHRIEAMVLSDESEVETTVWNVGYWNGYSLASQAPVTEIRGGLTGLIRYQGQVSENIILSASYGQSRFERTDRLEGDDDPYVNRYCDPAPCDNFSGWRKRARDDRRSFRVDAETFLGKHILSAGADVERNDIFDTKDYSGGIYYRYFDDGESPTGEAVRVRHYRSGGDFESNADAAFGQDHWAVNPSLTLSAGVRWERYSLSDGLGRSWAETDGQWSPRLGFVWDPWADGRTKVFGSFGRYTLPLLASAAVEMARAESFDQADFVWDGRYDLPGLTPTGYTDCGFGMLAECGNQGSIGDLLSYRIIADGQGRDRREAVASNIDPTSQDEIILGLERMVGDDWSFGVRGLWRELKQVVENFTIDAGLFDRYGLCDPAVGGCRLEYRLGNPGSDFEGWYDMGDDGILDPIHLTREELGYPKPQRTYFALELSFKRRFSDRWMLQGSYSWSHLYGNYEGPIRSDTGDDRAGVTTLFDNHGLTENSRGNLPQDRRHNLKVFGAYAFDSGWSVGGNVYFLSGRPVNALGLHPTDLAAAAYGAVSFFNQGRPAPRGCCGTTDNVIGADVMVRYRLSIDRVDLFWRLDIFNMTNRHAETEVDERADQWPGNMNPNYLTPTAYQRPRRVRLGFGLNF